MRGWKPRRVGVYNWSGTLGNNSSTNSSVPVLVSTTNLDRRRALRECVAGGGADHNLALVASPAPALATTLAATGITDTGATLNGSVNANGKAPPCRSNTA